MNSQRPESGPQVQNFPYLTITDGLENDGDDVDIVTNVLREI